MILLNFGHPLTEQHLQQIQRITAAPIAQVVEVNTYLDHYYPFPGQIVELVDRVGFDSRQWQTVAFLVNPPTLNVIAVTLLAELHGRMGYFPAVLRLRPLPDTTPLQFEVAEIINLQTVRDEARRQR